MVILYPENRPERTTGLFSGLDRVACKNNQGKNYAFIILTTSMHIASSFAILLKYKNK
jgi:hypothetical protein